MADDRQQDTGDQHHAGMRTIETAIAIADLATMADGACGDRLDRGPRWNGPRRREIARAREVVCDYLVGDNVYGSTDASLEAWFMAFAWSARRER